MRTQMFFVAMMATFRLFVGAQCEGCKYDNSLWEGSAGNDHLWEYTPGAGDSEGVCDPTSCEWSPCIFRGMLKFTNRGATAVQVHSPTGAVINIVQANGDSWTSNPLNVRSNCGQIDEEDPWYGAHPVGGGARLFGYIFSCTACVVPTED